MKSNKKTKNNLEPICYKPNIKDLPNLLILLEELKTKDEKKYFHFDVDKKSTTLIIYKIM